MSSFFPGQFWQTNSQQKRSMLGLGAPIEAKIEGVADLVIPAGRDLSPEIGVVCRGGPRERGILLWLAG